ncbi:MAG: class I SAM-dependent methyltransferase [Butyrivibrio sp.]|nr:class I SAM-dependent methyltransferase [Muribaculum sp.]MCM1552957.1 class I SAM-dependent methyltransferase [Butyrivibrio sp.]
MIRNDATIDTILDLGGIREGKSVLDVACGTGVLFPDYLKRNVSNIVGVDISPKMAAIAQAKIHDERLQVICADVQELKWDRQFDCIMIYNAFPHFPEPEILFAHLAGYLAPRGRITVAHGMSRDKIDAHHSGSARKVSMGLMHENALAEMMSQWFQVDVKIADTEKYIVSAFI